MKTLIICVLGLLVVTGSNAQSTKKERVKTYIKALNDTSRESCKNLKELKEKYESQNRPAAVESVEATMHNICTCMPEQIKKTKSRLSPKQLKTKVTSKQFMQTFQPAIDACAAAQLRYPYGKDCEKRFAKAKKNSTSYCRCMRGYLKKLTNAQITQIGRENSKYMNAVQIAKDKGLPQPQKPIFYDSFLQTDESCSAR